MKSYMLITFVVGWIRIFEGLIMILSLGLYYPNLEIAFLVWIRRFK